MHPLVERAVLYRDEHIDMFGELPKGPFIVFESEWESLRSDPLMVEYAEKHNVEITVNSIVLAGMRVKVIKD